MKFQRRRIFKATGNSQSMVKTCQAFSKPGWSYQSIYEIRPA